MSTLLKISAPIQERIVQVPGGETFAVRGLNPQHVVGLYKRHMGELEPMFAHVMAAAKDKGAVNPQDIQPLLLGLISQSPILMAELVVLATGGDPASMELVTITDPTSGEPVKLLEFDAALAIAQSLPFTVQVDALAKVGELTFSQDMPPGKFLALVLTLMRAMTGATAGMTACLPLAASGSGASGDPSTS